MNLFSISAKYFLAFNTLGPLELLTYVDHAQMFEILGRPVDAILFYALRPAGRLTLVMTFPVDFTGMERVFFSEIGLKLGQARFGRWHIPDPKTFEQ